MKQLTQEQIKKTVGAYAASLVKEGMLVGLGTGSTATYFIESLIERCRAGLKIVAVSSSICSLEQAQAGGIPTLDDEQFTTIDLTIDGADEIDTQNRMIKGAGGALVREKIIASSSHQFVAIVDETKLVPKLGKKALPVEIFSFGMRATLAKISKMGYEGEVRKKKDGAVYVTDNGNYIFDIHSHEGFANPEKDHGRLIALSGVVDTGFFFDLPVQVLVGYPDGNVRLRHEVHR
jgi:ribose 5-phosphate isomerase A